MDGQWHDVLARGVPVRNERGEITSWAGINLDISRLKRAEEEVRQANDQLDLRVQERTQQLSEMIDKLNVEALQRTLAEESLRESSEQLRLLASELTLAEQRERQRLAQVLHDGLQQILVGAKFRLALMQRTKDRDLQKTTSEVSDLIVMRQGLASLLRETPDIEIVGEASEGEAAVKLVRELLPDVILMDISLAGMNGIQATRIIHLEWPDIRIIGLSMFEEGERAATMRAAGAVGYLTKSGPSEDVIRAIRTCVQQRDQKA